MSPATVLALVDVSPLDRLAATANTAHVEGCREFLRHAVIAGQALIEAKKIVKGTGRSWTQWIKQNCTFSERTAQVYMQMARDPQRAADSLRQALREAFSEKAKGAAGPQPDPQGDPFDANLRVCSCAELFAAGIRPDAVITEPPREREHLAAFSELASACVDVPLVAIKVATPSLPEVLDRLREHLSYRGADIRDNKLILVFCQDEDAFERAKVRARTVPGPTSLRPYEKWPEYLVQRLAGPGELVCDPFLQADTAIAAVEFGRRFVGCHTDAGVVADTRRRIGVSR